MTRRWVINVSLLLVTLVVCLGITEMSLRIFLPQTTEPHPRGMYTADTELGFRMTPSETGILESPEFRVDVQTNGMGLRDQDLPAKEATEFRLLVLGDSFTFGFGVEERDTFARRIQHRIRATGRKEFRVINGGVVGYGTKQEQIWFDQIADAIEPDAVILGFFVGNDFVDNLNLNQYEVIDGYLVGTSIHGTNLMLTRVLGMPPRVKIAIRTHSHLYNFLMNAWRATMVKAGLSDSSAMYEIYRETPSAQTEQAVEATREALARLVLSCESREIPLGLVVIPDVRVRDVLMAKRHYRFERPSEVIVDMAKVLRVSVLDLTGMFVARDDLYYAVDRHWNAKGHRLAGDAIADALLRGVFKSLLGASTA